LGASAWRDREGSPCALIHGFLPQSHRLTGFSSSFLTLPTSPKKRR
jgi:hypothetical protein